MSDFVGSLLENNEESQTTSSIVGEFGEKVAKNHLIKNGYKIIMSNFKAPIGRTRKGVQFTGEIDLVALDDDVLCFIEVKTRSSNYFASPLTAIDIRKQRQITRTARVFKKLYNTTKVMQRFDAVAIVLNGKKAPNIKLVKGFWEESKFKKKTWVDEINKY